MWAEYKNRNINNMANTVIKCIGLYGLCIKIGNGTCELSIQMGMSITWKTKFLNVLGCV